MQQAQMQPQDEQLPLPIAYRGRCTPRGALVQNLRPLWHLDAERLDQLLARLVADDVAEHLAPGREEAATSAAS